MITIPQEIRNIYERSAVPMLLITMDDNGELRPVLMSDGLLAFHGLDREKAKMLFGSRATGGFFEKIHPDDISKIKVVEGEFLKKHGQYDVMFRSRKGVDSEYRMIHAVGYWQPLPDGSEVAVVAYADMSGHEEYVSDLVTRYNLFLRDEFYTDMLTGLPNLNYLNMCSEDRVREIRIGGAEPVVMYFDVDSMQFYNNQYGFKRGDQLLLLVARVLSDEFAQGLVVRAADDHFVVIDKFTDRDELGTKLTRINDRIKAEAFGITTGIHAGICVGDGFTSTAAAVDHAIRANKLISDDLNTVYKFYVEDDDTRFRHDRYVVENFYKAMNNGWIKVYYQCFLRLETGNGMGFEALARWKDPVKGMIPPDEFIPALEKYHLMHELDLYMFEQVCRELELRHRAGLPMLPVSVNFSRQDFDYIEVAAELERIIKKYHIEDYGIDKSYFMIEITEQGLASATDRFHEQLAAIKKSGFQLWVDDFGSGYSSLNVFSSFDIDLIKFDMDLLRNLDAHNGANRVILKAMVAAAKKLGIHTLCEGMETEEQKQFLIDIGCELAQGYLYHKPEGLDTIFERLNIGIPIPNWESNAERRELEKRWEESGLSDKFEL
ncbi:MAG: bifunctional diguanylate cyclase/phosphodiesterase [Lachnospiraceae bacterium]|nr:bifunctional diguanylate cyclase/phosphodiesterase [Lachnospiraceae bacterium]